MTLSMRLRNMVRDGGFGSWLGAAFFTFWIGQRTSANFDIVTSLTLYGLTWWLITFQYAVFVLAYLIRHKARERARGFIETIFPFFCAAMPFALIFDYPFRPPARNIVKLWPVSSALVIGGTLVIIVGIMYLRRSFSIMAEVRVPVYRGIYRWTRHPMYLGSMVTTLGTLIQNFSLWNCFLLVVFCCCQVYRAMREEEKIIRVFPEFARYASQVGWLWRYGRRKPSGNPGRPGFPNSTP
jgi:protein-S-isoprenylcysteine O-methyltransferase Ste14